MGFDPEKAQACTGHILQESNSNVATSGMWRHPYVYIQKVIVEESLHSRKKVVSHINYRSEAANV